MLHWLPAKLYICFKIPVLTFQAYCEIAKAYLREFIKKLHAVKIDLAI